MPSSSPEHSRLNEAITEGNDFELGQLRPATTARRSKCHGEDIPIEGQTPGAIATSVKSFIRLFELPRSTIASVFSATMVSVEYASTLAGACPRGA